MQLHNQPRKQEQKEQDGGESNLKQRYGNQYRGSSYLLFSTKFAKIAKINKLNAAM